MNLIYIIFCMFLISSILVFGKDIQNLYMQIIMNRRLKFRARAFEEKNSFLKYLERVSETVLGLKLKTSSQIFATIFLLIAGVSSINFSIIKGFFMSFIIIAFSIILVFLKFQSIRRKVSFEGEKLMINFLNQYRLCKNNIYETLEMMIINEEKNSKTVKLIKKLLLEIRNTGDRDKIKEATDEFAKVIDTNWGRMFAYNIQISALEGWNITTAIEDILVQLRDARTLEEERNRLNSETVRIITYMIPILYFLTLAMSMKFGEMNLKEFIRNQFFNREGFMLFVISFIFFLFNLIVIEAVTNRKFDY